MSNDPWQQELKEREKELDKLFLEFVVKRCALTTSDEEIISCVIHTLSKIPERTTESIPPAHFSSMIEAPQVVDVIPVPETEDELTEHNEELAESPLPSAESRENTEKREKRKKSFWGDLLFYGVLVALIVGVVFLTKNNEHGPRMIAGFTMQTVLTSSMESVIPKDSLIISHYTDPDTLEIGDDITFMTNETTTVTHRIIGIVENYADTGQRAFQTKGVMNSAPDSQLVPAVNVVGKVVFHSYAAGKAVKFIEKYWPLLLFFVVIFFVLIRVLKYIYRKDEGHIQKKSRVKKALS